MRKSDQVLMWEAFEGSISQGGPLGGSSTPSEANSTTTEQGEEESEGLMGLVAQLLQGVEDGSIDEGEACEHLKMVLSGEVEKMEDESPDEQEKENKGDYSAHEEDAENVKRVRPSAEEYRRSMGVRGPGGKDLNKKKNTPRLDPLGRPMKDIQGV